MAGLFITFEGNEGSGKSTQVALLAQQLCALGFTTRTLREPGSTPIGEEIRHTLKHSTNSAAMTPETELLLVNASRAQLVREVIRPALAVDEVVLCDRFYDSTIAYQGYGRGLELGPIYSLNELVVGATRPDLTLLLLVPQEVSEARRLARHATLPFLRDRMEEADRSFFERVAQGYDAIALAEPKRVYPVDATRSIEEVRLRIWQRIEPLLAQKSSLAFT